MVWWLWTPQWNPYLATSPQDAALPLDAAFESLSKHGLQACCMWSPEDGFYHFSENWAGVTGQLPRDCEGERWLACWHDYTRTVFEQTVQDLFSPCPEDRTDTAVIEGDVMHGEGSWITLQFSLVPAGMGSARKLTVLVTDVTEQRRLQEQMRLAQRQSQAMAQSRASFLSNMSHELRTPLNAILGFAQMLESGAPASEDAARDYLQHIRTSGEDLLHKINDLIEVANIDSGRATLEDAAINLHEAIGAAIEMQSHHAFERRITLRQDHQQPHLLIRADRARLIHCLSHLLSNAIAHSPEGSAVTLSYQAGHETGIRLSVRDSGCGIPQRKLNNIRTTLRRKASYYHTDIEDIGIGLSVCKEIVELHGGQMDIESCARLGTAVTIQLPPERIVSLSARLRARTKQIG